MPGSDLSEAAVGCILLIGSLIVMLLSIFLMVKVLQDLFKGAAAHWICKVLNANFPGYLSWATGYAAMLIGCFFTFLMQSSSVFTSIMTPLVGAGLVTLERMYPLTLGANIGTTVTSMIAAMTNEGQGLKDALQVSFVHLMFNLIGICIWYPIPFMRRAPIWLAKFLGYTTAEYRWFSIAYLVVMFLLFPLIIFGLAVAGQEVLLAVAIPIIVFVIVLIIINVIQRTKPQWLPKRLRSWDWLPLWMHSLQPWDSFFTRCCTCRCCRKYCKCCNNKDEDVETVDSNSDTVQDSDSQTEEREGTIDTDNQTQSCVIETETLNGEPSVSNGELDHNETPNEESHKNETPNGVLSQTHTNANELASDEPGENNPAFANE